MLPGAINTYGRRPTQGQVLMSLAGMTAQRSTCSRLKVGAVIAREGRVVSTGYNGTPSGMEHCDHTSDSPCEAAVHAEANAVAFAARHGVATQDADLYVTAAPCLKCAQLIVACGIKTVFYAIAYRRPEGLILLQQANVAVVRV